MIKNKGSLIKPVIEGLLQKAVQAKKTIAVADLLSNKKGEPFTVIQDKSTVTYRVGLFKWLPGTDFKDQETKDLFFQLGQKVAKLHQITRDISLPSNITPKKWDQVFYFREEEILYPQSKYDPLFSKEDRDFLKDAINFLNQHLKRIHASRQSQLLHGDLNPWNIKLYQNQLAFFDFEDIIYGPPIQELAILLYYYENNEIFDYSTVKTQVLKGYNSVENSIYFKEEDLILLRIARRINLMNFALTKEGEYNEYVLNCKAKIKKFMDSVS